MQPCQKSITICEEKLEEAQKEEVKLDCNDKSHQKKLKNSFV